MDLIQWEKEEKHLALVYQKILAEYARRKKETDTYFHNLIKTGRSIWEEGDHTWEYGDMDAAAEIKQSVDALKQETHRHNIARLQLSKVERLMEIPYFGRIDFTEKGYSDTEEIYIGVTSFFDERGGILIYDWRAPVSSIFYDYELGPVSYLCQDGRIEGMVSLKRQYRIHRDELLYMFDTGIKIDDEMLQEILSRNVDEKMRNIVNTIQKEQNRIIRDESHQLLMVQGVAGSGKTSIALHRIAYMLYRYRDENMTSKNILIFSPNTVFNDYISNVLPELGEENMRQTTFNECMEKLTGSSFVFENSSSQMEYILTASETGKDLPRLRGIAYKSSYGFLRLLNDYASYLEYESISFRDVVFNGQLIASAEDIKRLYYGDFSWLPVAKRLQRIKNRLLYLARPAWRQRLDEIRHEIAGDPEYSLRLKAYSRLFLFREFKKVRTAIDEMLSFDTYQAYIGLYENEGLFERLAGANQPPHFREICKDTAERLRQNILSYEDAAAYVYFKGIMEGVSSKDDIRHVVVDEAQDYTPVQYGILKQLFPATRMTLLGDFNQAINPLKDRFGYEDVLDILKPANHLVLKLTRGYRSTSDIVNFTRLILDGEQQIESIQRKGEKPCIISGGDEKALIAEMISDIRKMMADGIESVGILCRTAEMSRLLFDQIKKELRAVLLTSDDTNFSKGIVVLPVYLAKGLEFDAAVVYGADAVNYGKEQDRRMFYTACTRALHRLNIYHTGEVSPFVSDIPSEYYVSRHI